MTPRQAKLVDAATACENAAREIELDFPRSELSDPMVKPLRRELVAVRQRDIGSLKLAAATIKAIAEDPESYGLLVKLRAEKPKEFAAIMVLVQNELEPPAPAEQARAA